MRCDRCQKDALALTAVRIRTGKRGRPPVKNYCETCVATDDGTFYVPEDAVTVTAEASAPVAAPKQTKRPKKLALTRDEAAILAFPPTLDTWICEGEHRNNAGTLFVVPNPGQADKCWLCAKSKPSKPKRRWTQYVELCKRVGVEPGYAWKRFENGRAMMKKRGEKWQTAPES